MSDNLDAATLREEIAYRQAMVATSLGRQSVEICKEAAWLEEIGRKREALESRRRAVALFPESDNGAAAASARHDLGHSLCNEEDVHRLAEAMRLLKLALASPARQRALSRYAETANSLAVCLRRLSHHVDGEERERLLDEAEALYRENIRRARGLGGAGTWLRAKAHLNLGNVLGLERGDVEGALDQYEKAADESLQVMMSEPEIDARMVFHCARVNAAELLVNRGLSQDLELAERLAQESLKQGDSQYEGHARLILARALLAGTVTGREERAREILSRIRPQELTYEQQMLQAHLLSRAGATEAALDLLHALIVRGIDSRARATIADFEADAASQKIQSAAALAARIRIQQKQDPVGAFLVLENSSGLRFAEVLSAHAWSPQSLVTQILHGDLSEAMQQAYILDGTARLLDRMAPDAQHKLLDKLLKDLEGHGSVDSLRPIYERALRERVPVDYLDALIQEGRERVVQRRYALATVDKDYARVREALSEELDEQGLRELLLEHPGHALLRLSLDRDLLVVGVWLEGDRLVARSTTVEVPHEIFPLLRRAVDPNNPERCESSERLGNLLERLDLSSSLPEQQLERAVLLPSFHAALLPLAALGPQGARPVDRFNSLIWLPCLFPLRVKPAATPRREGSAIVIPVPGSGRGETHFHALAFQQHAPQELRLESAAATSETIAQAAATANVLCVYTHGDHQPGQIPELALSSGQRLDLEQLAGAVAGIERVELWACQSGAHQPSDPFTPPADEGFGLDFTLVLQGARSAVGTLWPVTELITAVLVCRYRRQVLAGADPATALAEAQRWWVREGGAELIRLFRAMSVDEAVRAFTRTLGLELGNVPRQALVGTLGEYADNCSEEELRRLAVQFACPTSWAGLRFVGVPGRTPPKPWEALPERPLSTEEQQELERLRKLELPRPVPFEELQEKWLARAMRLRQGETPSPTQALEVARLLRDRLRSSHRDNLLAALAWLHEALAAPGLDKGDRRRLSIEAAHLWLELAWGEHPVPIAPEPIFLTRAGLLLSVLPGGAPAAVAADAEAARAKLQLLKELPHAGTDRKHGRAIKAALEHAKRALRHVPHQTPEALRVATVALEILALRDSKSIAADAPIIEMAQAVRQAVEPTDATGAAWCRLRDALERHASTQGAAVQALNFLTPRELASAVQRELLELGPRPGAPTLPPIYNEALSRLESRIWGSPSDDGSLLLLSTGVPGVAYRLMLKSYLTGHSLSHPNEAVHQIACLQYSCDLRISLMNRLARFSLLSRQGPVPMIEQLRDCLRIRQLLQKMIVDITLLGEPPLPGKEGWGRPHRLDAYALPSQALREGCNDLTCYTAWSLDDACNVVHQDGPRARTAAFDAVRASSMIEDHSRQYWDALLDAERQARDQLGTNERIGLSRQFTAGRRLVDNEAMLRELPAGHGVIGLCLDIQGGLLLMACWNTGQERGQRTWRIEGSQLQGLLTKLLCIHSEDLGPRKDPSVSLRKEAWTLIEKALSPTLELLLQEAQKQRRLHWAVLAPGALRSLPLLGLRVAGHLLAEQVESLVHLPSLGFAPLVDPREQLRERTACLLARDSEGRVTCFGEAAVETLRRLHPPALIVDPKELRGSYVVEVDTLEPQADQLRTLRMYGVGGNESVNDSTAMIHLEGGRMLRERNTQSLLLSRCDVVELWACTAGMADFRRILRDDGDRIPALAESFLSCGAAAVIDLAWPAHDAVKALVCEHYGLERQRRGHGPEILALAVARTASMLERLRQEAAGRTVREVLDSLDAMRQHAAVLHYEVDPRRFVPFADAARQPLTERLTGDDLIEELCHPVHLGAFRWWGA